MDLPSEFLFVSVGGSGWPTRGFLVILLVVIVVVCVAVGFFGLIFFF